MEKYFSFCKHSIMILSFLQIRSAFPQNFTLKTHYQFSNFLQLVKDFTARGTSVLDFFHSWSCDSFMMTSLLQIVNKLFASCFSKSLLQFCKWQDATSLVLTDALQLDEINRLLQLVGNKIQKNSNSKQILIALMNRHFN